MQDLNPKQAGERIRRLRRFLVVHSRIYYCLNDNLVSDHMFDAAGKELAELQEKYGYVYHLWDEEFKDWTGGTGFHLPLQDEWAVNKAAQLLRYAKP